MGEWGAGRTLTPQDQTLLTYQVHSKQNTEHLSLQTLPLLHFPHVSELPQGKWTGTCCPKEKAATKRSLSGLPKR